MSFESICEMLRFNYSKSYEWLLSLTLIPGQEKLWKYLAKHWVPLWHLIMSWKKQHTDWCLLSLQEQKLNSLQKLDGKITNTQLITRKYFRAMTLKSGLSYCVICSCILGQQMQDLKDISLDVYYFFIKERLMLKAYIVCFSILVLGLFILKTPLKLNGSF